jgi:hypothetical protein
MFIVFVIRKVMQSYVILPTQPKLLLKNCLAAPARVLSEACVGLPFFWEGFPFFCGGLSFFCGGFP